MGERARGSLVRRRGRLFSIHDTYDLAFGPGDGVRRNVRRLPVPESQLETVDERVERERQERRKKNVERLEEIAARREKYRPEIRFPYGLCGPILNERYCPILTRERELETVLDLLF